MADRDINILIKAKDMASKVIKGVSGNLNKLGSHVSKGLGNLSRNLQRGATAIGVGLAGAVGVGIRNMMELERVMNQTNAVITSTGKHAGVSANEVYMLAQQIENLTTADDKAVQSGLNVLLTFNKMNKETFPRAAKAATNLAIAMAGGDVENANYAQSAKLVGKALDDPIKGVSALRKANIILSKAQQDSIKWLVAHGRSAEAQGIILTELEKRYGKAGEAASKGAGGAWRRLKDIGEKLSITLAKGVLPSLVKVSEWLSEKLMDEDVQQGIENFGEELGKLVDQGLAFVDKVDWKGVGKTLGDAKNAVVGIVQAFAGMPDWVKTAVITGWGLNKLTGGAVGGIVTELAKGLVRGVLGINAGVVNLKAASVVGGGVGGVGAGGKGMKGRIGGAIGGVGSALAVLGVGMLAVELMNVKNEQSEANKKHGAETVGQAKDFAATADLKTMKNSLAGIESYTRGLESGLTPESIAFALDIDGVKTSVNATRAELQSGIAREEAAIAALRERQAERLGAVITAVNSGNSGVKAAVGNVQSAMNNARSAIAGAITNKRWQFTSNVHISNDFNVSGRDVAHAVNAFSKKEII